jgi:hypothetical protein
MKYLMLCAVIMLTAFTQEPKPTASTSKIQIALLLDTSNSMDGLIEQAKGKLWTIVNEFSRYEKGKEAPQLEIALFEYGNDRLDANDEWIKQISAFTTDLDFISQKLFELQTYGGSEHCGAVIHEANQRLEWSRQKDDLKLIFIAGNEIFNQGKFNYRDACAESIGKDIAVNTIYCGDYEQGVQELWKEGAIIGKGKYINIDHNRSVTYIETPYDKKLQELNEELNKTYIYYGSQGADKKQNQMMQDSNAEGFSGANLAERTVSKSSAAYKNAQWDAVDALKEGEIKAEDLVKDKNLAPELQNKTAEEVEKYLEEMNVLRDDVRRKIGAINIEREAYIAKNSSSEDNTLDGAIKKVVAELAIAKGFNLKSN